MVRGQRRRLSAALVLIPPARWKLSVGVVDQDLHRRELGLGAGDHDLDALRVGDVALYGDGLGAALVDVIGVGSASRGSSSGSRLSQPSSPTARLASSSPFSLRSRRRLRRHRGAGRRDDAVHLHDHLGRLSVHTKPSRPRPPSQIAWRRTYLPRRRSLPTHPPVNQPLRVHRSCAGSPATAPRAPRNGSRR